MMRLLLLLLLPLLICAAPSDLTEQERKDGWRLLFDGKSVTGWRSLGNRDFPSKGWVVEDGCLKHVAKQRGGDITPDGTFENFELALEYKISEGGNSGIKYKVEEQAGQTFAFGIEYQIVDNARHPDAKMAKRRSGALYDMFEAQPHTLKPPGEWNAVKIVVNGNHVEHWLNGTKIVECEINSPEWKAAFEKSKYRPNPKFGQTKRGNIILQDHGDEVWFRNIRIRELGKDIKRET